MNDVSEGPGRLTVLMVVFAIGSSGSTQEKTRAMQTAVIGGLAAGAAFLIARVFS